MSFFARFDEDTVLVGYPKAHLWVEAAARTTWTCGQHVLHTGGGHASYLQLQVQARTP